MFDELRRELKALEHGVNISIPIELDDDGYLDRLCHWEQCGFSFKLLHADWVEKVNDEGLHCPACGRAAPAQEYNTPEQEQYLTDAAPAALQARINRGLRSSARGFNRHQRPRSGLISLSIRMDVNTPPHIIAVPLAAEEVMTLRITCEKCTCRFAVVGSAYFCPACGYNSAGQVFDQSIASMRATMAALPALKASIPDRDIAARMASDLIEGGIGNLVTAFQRFAESEYPRLSGPVGKLRRNVFQNLSEGSVLWEKAGGKPYDDHLDVTEQADLQRLFQQRHLLAHQQGVVDADYVSKSGDKTYAVGQRLVVREPAVLRLAALLEKLVAGLRQDLPA